MYKLCLLVSLLALPSFGMERNAIDDDDLYGVQSGYCSEQNAIISSPNPVCLPDAQNSQKARAELGAKLVEAALMLRNPKDFSIGNVKKFMREYIEAGADVNYQNTSGSPLSIALRQKAYDAVELLLSLGANANLIQQDGEIPLRLAVMTRNTSFVQLLLDYGAEVNLKSNNELSALAAAITIDCNMVKFLLEKGADPNVKLKNGDTVLMLAARYALEPVVKLLLERGADAQARDDKGHSVTSVSSEIRQLIERSVNRK